MIRYKLNSFDRRVTGSLGVPSSWRSTVPMLLDPLFGLKMRVLLVVCALILIGCATPSPALPVAPPTIPAPPAVSVPKDSGHYWKKHCEILKSVREQLKLPPTMFERCSEVGL